METSKTCSHCKQTLPLSAFGTHKKTAPNGKKYDFRRHVCKPCYSAAEKVRRIAKHPLVRNPGPYKPKPYAEWTSKQKEAHGIRAQKRRAKVLSLPYNFTSKDWKTALEYFEHKCAYCSSPLSKAEQEHFIPVKQGGGFTRDNIVPACSSCNSDKRGKNPIDWLASKVYGLIAYARVITYFSKITAP